MAAGTRFNPPPGWQVPPGFTPSADWRPDPSWPPAPHGWQFWITDPPDGMTVAATPTAAPGTAPPHQAAPFTPPAAPAAPAPAPSAWGPGGGPGYAAQPGFAPPMQQGPFYSATQTAKPGSGLGVGIPGLLLALVGLLVVLALQIMLYAQVHSAHPSYSQTFVTVEKVLSWIGAAVFAPATILGAIGARKPKGGVALAALVVCGLSAAIFAVPVW